MSDKDHEEMLRELLKSSAKIMISGYESDMYNDYLHTWNKTCFNGCAEYGKRRKEVIWMNYSDKQLSFKDFPEIMPETDNCQGLEKNKICPKIWD